MKNALVFKESNNREQPFISNDIKSKSNNDIDDISIEDVKRRPVENDRSDTPIRSAFQTPTESKSDKDLDYILSMNTEELFKNTNKPRGTFGSISDFVQGIEESKHQTEFNNDVKKNYNDDSWKTAKF